MTCFYTAGHTPALEYAVKKLQEIYPFSPVPDSNVTHILLPVPTLDSQGLIKGGEDLSKLLSKVPVTATVIGGNLPQWVRESHPVTDLMKNPVYTSMNARITAHCAVKELLSRYPCIMPDTAVLILGWGRIGKCLAELLKSMGAAVTVYARKEKDRAMAESLGFSVSAVPAADADVIINTVPAMILPNPPENACLMDLASIPGIGGEHVYWARFLPGKDAPGSSGKLIADTVSRMIEEGNR